MSEMKKVCFIGAGTQGCINSLVCGMAGYEAVVYDTSAEALSMVPLRQEVIGQRMVEMRGFDPKAIKAGMKKVRLVSDPREAVAEADLLSESVPERLELKRRVHQELDELCPERTIMTTNTSSISLSAIEDVVQRGDRFAAMHFHGPGTLADIVAGPRTSPETIATLITYVKTTGQYPMVLKKERPGYLHNTLFINLLKTGALLVAEGHADIEDVDRSWMIVEQARSGPFGMMDAVGLNIVLEVGEEEYKRTGDPDLKKMADFVRPYVERGELGMKSGKGFYAYPDAAWMKPEFLVYQDE